MHIYNKELKRYETNFGEAVYDTIDTKVYTIGDNKYNELSGTIYESVDPFDISRDFLTEDEKMLNEVTPREHSDNEFLKPSAGITSVSSTTEGTLGAIKKTTVTFKVHNFHDFENIYSKYFLRPGALIFVDFGWDTGPIYNTSELI